MDMSCLGTQRSDGVQEIQLLGVIPAEAEAVWDVKASPLSSIYPLQDPPSVDYHPRSTQGYYSHGKIATGTTTGVHNRLSVRTGFRVIHEGREEMKHDGLHGV